MGSDYNVELARVKHPELKKERKDKLSGVKVPETDMLNIPLITNMDGKVQHTLMGCVLFMKNLPPSIEVPDSASSPRNSPTPQPSSPLVWSPSPPCRDHCKVVPLPHPIPTKVPPHQPSSQKGVVIHNLNPRLMSQTTCPAPGAVDLHCWSVETFNKNNKPNNTTGQQFLCLEGWFSSCSKGGLTLVVLQTLQVVECLGE
jgi:hypothetical protein